MNTVVSILPNPELCEFARNFGRLDLLGRLFFAESRLISNANDKAVANERGTDIMLTQDF